MGIAGHTRALVRHAVRCHWRYTLFDASERKLQGYNDCFRGIIRLFPMSDKQLGPDLNHIVLHVLILVNIALCLIVEGTR